MKLYEEIITKPNYSLVRSKIENFIKKYFEESGAKGVVIGLSGGVDSSTVATLLVRALGKEKVLGLIMPHKETSSRDINDALEIAKLLGIEYKVVHIDKPVEAIVKISPWLASKTDKVVRGNIIARVRMTILYYHANALNYLVSGTGDKSEYLLGYFTKYGDGAADFFPILDLYKSQVRELAKRLGVPEKIYSKPSSPGLWRNHLAIDELGFEYDVIDQVLYGYFEKKMDIAFLAKEIGISVNDVKNILLRVKRSKHKRELPPYPKLF